MTIHCHAPKQDGTKTVVPIPTLVQAELIPLDLADDWFVSLVAREGKKASVIDVYFVRQPGEANLRRIVAMQCDVQFLRHGLYESHIFHGNGLASFEEVLHIQVDSFANIGERFFIAAAPTMAALQSRAGYVPSPSAIFELIGLENDFVEVGIHCSLRIIMKAAAGFAPEPARGHIFL